MLRDELRWTGVTVGSERAIVRQRSDLCSRTAECRYPDALCEFVADRSRALICSRRFKRFWRMCPSPFLTAPYKNCTHSVLSSARFSVSVRTPFKCAHPGRALAVHDQISIAVMIVALDGAHIGAAHGAETGRPSSTDCDRIEARD